MRTLTRVGVFEEMGAVEFGKAVTVSREVRGSPIEQDADAFLVATIDEVHEIGGRTEAASSGVVAGSLVTPRGHKKGAPVVERCGLRVAQRVELRRFLFS